VFGDNLVFEKFGLKPFIHKNELVIYNTAKEYAGMFGLTMKDLPEPVVCLADSAIYKFGNTTLKLILAPGHSPGSICFYHSESNSLIAGDVLFQMSIGRTDLPLGDPNTLLYSIRDKILVLAEETTVYPGHGPTTSI